jgi:hypothetical protein
MILRGMVKSPIDSGILVAVALAKVNAGRGADGFAGFDALRAIHQMPGSQRAPLSMQEVVQVVVTPRSQERQAFTHCFMSLGLYTL